MNKMLNRNLYFVKEHVGMFKAANNYDILDPETQEIVLLCREEKLGFFTKIFRFTDYKRMTPFNVVIKSAEGEKVISIKRGVSFFVSKVEVFDESDRLVGLFKQKFFSFGGRFNVLDADENIVCTLKGKWTSWDFRFEREGVELAKVTKKWAGFGKELFTTADNYMLEIKEEVKPDHPIRILIIAAVMCIDMVLKE